MKTSQCQQNSELTQIKADHNERTLMYMMSATQNEENLERHKPQDDLVQQCLPKQLSITTS